MNKLFPRADVFKHKSQVTWAQPSAEMDTKPVTLFQPLKRSDTDRLAVIVDPEGEGDHFTLNIKAHALL